MIIRLMRTSDYKELYALWLKIDGIGMRSLDDSPEGISKFLIRNPSTCFVAEENEKLIGAILCGHDGRRGYIYHAAVLQCYKGKGTGKALVESALKALRAQGINKAALVAFKTNETGNAFWKAVGFGARNDLVYRDFNLNEKNI